MWHFKQGLSDRIRAAIAIYGDDDLDTVVLQAKRVDAAFRLKGVTSSTLHSSSKKPASGAGTKRPAKTASGDAKRAKVGGPLVNLRLAERVCTNCRVPRAAHDSSTLGLKCTKPAVPATAAELAALEKGKAKA